MTTRTRERRFLELIAKMRSDIDDLGQRRPEDTAPTIARSLRETGVVGEDRLTYTTVTSPTFTFGDPDRGFGHGEWGTPIATLTGNPGTVGANYFGPPSDPDHPNAVGYFRTDKTDVTQGTDGWGEVGYADASTNPGFEAVFSSEFTTDDFPGYAGPGQEVYMAFAFRGNALPVWQNGGVGEWVSQPTPSETAYRLCILRSDGQNSIGAGEYFRLYYADTDDTSYGYFADPIVWKATDADETDVHFDADARALAVFGVEGYRDVSGPEPTGYGTGGYGSGGYGE